MVENHLCDTGTAHDYLRVIQSIAPPRQLPRVATGVQALGGIERSAAILRHRRRRRNSA